MLTFNQYQEINRVKDSSPFTQELSLQLYIQHVRTRIHKWYGTPMEKITEEMVYEELTKK